MKAHEMELLEIYFTTKNQYWNEFVFSIYRDTIESGEFEDSRLPVLMFDKSTDIFLENHEHPLLAVQIFDDRLEKESVNPKQKLFIYEWIFKYLKQTRIEGYDLKMIRDLIKSKIEKLKSEIKPGKPLTSNIRESLKAMIQKELEQLPETLKGLEPIQRLNILCKLMPFVLPKVESVSHDHGEPRNNPL